MNIYAKTATPYPTLALLGLNSGKGDTLVGKVVLGFLGRKGYLSGRCRWEYFWAGRDTLVGGSILYYYELAKKSKMELEV
jgi:hypothetical protein